MWPPRRPSGRKPSSCWTGWYCRRGGRSRAPGGRGGAHRGGTGPAAGPGRSRRRPPKPRRSPMDTGNPDLFPPVIDSIAVDSGFEMALAAALDDGRPRWTKARRCIGAGRPARRPIAARGGRMPGEARQGAGRLARRLSHTGLVADEATDGDCPPGLPRSAACHPQRRPLALGRLRRCRGPDRGRAAPDPEEPPCGPGRRHRVPEQADAAFEAAGARQDETREKVRANRRTWTTHLPSSAAPATCWPGSDARPRHGVA